MAMLLEPTKEEYEQESKRCQGLLIPEGGKASLLYGTAFVVAMLAFRRFTKLGQRISFHPYALLGTAGYVAPFWIVGEQAVIFCNRNAFEKRKANVGTAFQKERFNHD